MRFRATRVNKRPVIDPANQRVPGLRPWRPGPTLSLAWPYTEYHINIIILNVVNYNHANITFTEKTETYMELLEQSARYSLLESSTT